MKALIFAAGKGERLRPLTMHTPKPLATINGKPLIQYHVEALFNAGINEIVINVSWLHQQIIEFVSELMSQEKFNQCQVKFSIEQPAPLETGGGMLKALPLLGNDPFVVVNADIYTDFEFRDLDLELKGNLVNLVLVDNPDHNPSGDFGLVNGQLQLKSATSKSFTYAGIGYYSPEILKPPFSGDVFSIVPLIKSAINNGCATGQIHHGTWHDVGTLERLNELNQQ